MHDKEEHQDEAGMGRAEKHWSGQTRHERGKRKTKVRRRMLGVRMEDKYLFINIICFKFELYIHN